MKTFSQPTAQLSATSIPNEPAPISPPAQLGSARVQRSERCKLVAVAQYRLGLRVASWLPLCLSDWPVGQLAGSSQRTERASVRESAAAVAGP